MQFKEQTIHTNFIKTWCSRALCLLLFFVFSNTILAQNKPVISSKADTTAIKIGEQIIWTVSVEVDSTDHVIFPEGQTFSPLEMVEAMIADTTQKKDRVLLERSYILTQFDSGSYKLPTQFISINDQGYYTDSLQVQVADVKVDTFAQKMYDIKKLMEVEKGNSSWWNIILAILGLILLVAGLLYWFVFREKPLTEEEKIALLPPYDRALIELKNLENSKYLIQDQYKAYYSELTEIVRSYLEDDVQITALESTTDELISKLELLSDAGKLELDKATINQFKQILQTADLVKFARLKPEVSVAEENRKSIEQIVIKTHEALPEPTEEELMQLAEYQEELERKKQKKKIVIAALSVAAILLISAISATYYYGFENTKDTILRHPTKILLESEWVSSGYGYPRMQINAPGVLKRSEGEMLSGLVDLDTVNDATKKAALEMIKKINSSYDLTISEFLLDTDYDDFYLKYDDISMPADSVSLERETMAGIEMMEKQERFKNIIVKDDVYKTPEGSEGLKQYGTLSFKNKDGDFDKKKYTILTFVRPSNLKRLTMIWNVEDEYAEKIVERVISSVEIKAE